MKTRNYYIFEKRNRKKCPYDNIEDCRVFGKKCKYDKKTCIIKRSKKDNIYRMDPLKKSILHWIGYSAALIIILKFLMAIDFPPIINDIVDTIYNVFIAILAAAVFTIFIDLPSKLRDYEHSLIRAITSDEYVKKLDENRLRKLRKSITNELHLKDQKSVQADLIKLDEEICEYLNKPFYEYYRHYVYCQKAKNEGFICKLNTINYQLINNNHDNVSEAIKLGVILKIDKPSDLTDKFNLLYIKIGIDGFEKTEYNDFEIITDDIKTPDFLNCYNTRILLKAKNKTDDILIEYDTKLEVEICYEVVVPDNDICFTKRLQKPTKNFIIDYSHNMEGIKLFGQIFGTNMAVKDFIVNNFSNYHITMEAHKWMLPRNGAMITFVPIDKID